MARNWTYIVTNLLGTQQLGEVTNARSRTLNFPLNRIPTAGFTIPGNHYLAQYFVDPTWDGLLKVYCDQQLVFCGPVVSSDDQYDASVQMQMITVAASGPMWRLGFKLLGRDATGLSLASVASPVDVVILAEFVLAGANADWPTHPTSSSPYTGITLGSATTSGVTGSAGPYFFKPASDAIAELAVGAYDFEVSPVEPIGVGLVWPHIGDLNLQPRIGLNSATVQPSAVFEFGTSSANLASYGRNIDRSQMATLGFIQQPAASDHSGTLYSVDDTAEGTRGRFEALIDDGGVQWNNLRQELADKNVAVRKQARQLVSITCRPNAQPQLFNGLSVGDDFKLYMKLNENFVLQAISRAWGIQLDIDQNGNETQTIAVVPQ